METLLDAFIESLGGVYTENPRVRIYGDCCMKLTVTDVAIFLSDRLLGFLIDLDMIVL